MAKFTRVGIACNVINLDDNTTNTFTFTPKSFTFTTVSLTPEKEATFLIKFFGLTKGDKLKLLYRFLLEENYRN